MYAHLTGNITYLGPDHAVIDVSGIGYQLACSTRTLGNLQTGQTTRLLTVLNVREDALTLFGFADISEKELFQRLTTVSGVGPRLALSLLSTWSPADISTAIQTGQPGVLAKASGVGKKMAEKIIVELKDKLGSLPLLTSPTTGTPVSIQGHDVTSALINLGYNPKTAESATQKALEESPDAPFETLFRQALKHAA